ncbi:thiolase [Choiromyces venosus 120613-1]|uniref:acetyl-CoA C-acyltransferase n=1 Tax=Choiromyces venosus 120613-1 TaxID=1336337 RepID=A0A3N4JKB9_9PEZI|nr:thiolase [Choiromyces venosus 120613-1]
MAAKYLTKLPTDIVLTAALRTPITKAYKGAFRKTHPERLLSSLLSSLRQSSPGLPVSAIDDVCIGTVLQELGGAKVGRMAALYSGIPPRAGFSTVNRQCASSLQAIATIANALRAGEIYVGIAGGMESMSLNYASKAIPATVWDELRQGLAGDCMLPMGITSEVLTQRYGVVRADMDAFAKRSHEKALHAREMGRFEREIAPVTIENPDEGGEGEEIVVSKDDGIRPGVSISSLEKLPPAFTPMGSSTAGNSSQVSDGAAGVVMMRRETAEYYSLLPLAKYIGSVSVGVLPDEMGVGPAVAIPKLLHFTGLSKNDVDVWEINEAFASQALYCINTLGLDVRRVNPSGGAIALGHPLGATGARMMATLVHGMRRRGEEVGVLSMCIGAGQGMAGLVIAE